MSKQTKTAAQLAKERAAAKTPRLTAFGRAMFQMMGIPVMMDEETVAETEDLVDVAQNDETGSGEPQMAFDLAEGGTVIVAFDNYATLDGEQMPAGEHALADGNFLVIDENGYMVVTQPEADGTQPEQAEAALSAAKERGAQFMAAQKLARENAKLRKQLAEMKKQPSTGGKATPVVEGAGHKPVTAASSYAEKAAALIAAQRERKGK